MFKLCLVFFMLWRLFIAALWSPAGKGLTSWLLLVMFIVFCCFLMWYPGSVAVLDCIVFLIVAVFLTFTINLVFSISFTEKTSGSRCQQRINHKVLIFISRIF